MIEIATDRKWKKNIKPKHSKDAKYGWYYYSTRFAIPKMDSNNNVMNFNVYTAKLVIRNDENGKKYLYDIIQNIKKENSSRLPAPLIAKVRNIRSNSLNLTIPQNNSVVNRNYAQNSENNTNSVDEGKYSFGDEDEQYLRFFLSFCVNSKNGEVIGEIISVYQKISIKKPHFPNNFAEKCGFTGRGDKI